MAEENTQPKIGIPRTSVMIGGITTFEPAEFHKIGDDLEKIIAKAPLVFHTRTIIIERGDSAKRVYSVIDYVLDNSKSSLQYSQSYRGKFFEDKLE